MEELKAHLETHKYRQHSTNMTVVIAPNISVFLNYIHNNGLDPQADAFKGIDPNTRREHVYINEAKAMKDTIGLRFDEYVILDEYYAREKTNDIAPWAHEDKKEPLGINALVEIAHAAAKEKGWWDDEKSFAELVMLIVTEAAEAVEEFRAGYNPNETYYNTNKPTKPEGIPSELADMVIRIADLCGRYGIDLEAIIREKLEYNRSRDYRHGNKRL